MTHHTPPRSRLEDEKLIAAWGQMPEAIQRELLRVERETQRGIAIQKDRMMGREKYCLGGFYGLELLDEQCYALEHNPRQAESFKEATAKAAELRAKLADDEQLTAERMRQHEELEPFREAFAAEGKTVGQKIREYVDLENALRDDLLGGIFSVCEYVGADPIQVLTSALNRPKEATSQHA